MQLLLRRLYYPCSKAKANFSPQTSNKGVHKVTKVFCRCPVLMWTIIKTSPPIGCRRVSKQKTVLIALLPTALE